MTASRRVSAPAKTSFRSVVKPAGPVTAVSRPGGALASSVRAQLLDRLGDRVAVARSQRERQEGGGAVSRLRQRRQPLDRKRQIAPGGRGAHLVERVPVLRRQAAVAGGDDDRGRDVAGGEPACRLQRRDRLGAAGQEVGGVALLDLLELARLGGEPGGEHDPDQGDEQLGAAAG